MQRNLTWLLSTLTVLVLLFGYHTSTAGAPSLGGTAIVSSDTGSATGPGATAASGGGTSGGGSVTGPVVTTRWGPVQVQVKVTGGQITGVWVLQYPTGRHEDEQINGYALPILIRETIDAQSADVDMVSGATVTSEGYRQSLQAALDQVGL